MRRIPAVLAVLFCVLLLCCCNGNAPLKASYTTSSYTLSLEGDKVVSDTDWVVNLNNPKDRDFVILNLTDIQLSTTEYILNFDHIRDMVTSLVEKTKPDLITYLGDMSYGHWGSDLGICSFIDSFGIPWAPVFGNHDMEDSGMAPDTLARVFRSFRNCVFRDGPSLLAVDPSYNVEDKGNYVVNIVDVNDDGFEVVKSLVFFNSGTEGATDLQMQWYQDCMDSVCSYGGSDPVSSAVFMHIPIYEYRTAILAACKSRYVTPAESYDPLSWNPGYEGSFGVWYEGIGYKSGKPGFADLLKAKGNDLLVCGHNHTNSFCVNYEGMTYLYALKTGPGCYYEEGMEGGTEIRVSASGSFDVTHWYFYDGQGCFDRPQDFI